MKVQLLTANQLARRIGVSSTTISRATRSQLITPDFVAGDIQLFRPGHVERIAATFGTGRKVGR